MSELPNGWFSLKCGDTFTQISTSNIKVKTKDTQPEGQFPVIDQGAQFIAGYIDDEDRVISIEKPVCVFGDHTRVVKWVDFNFVPGADGTKILVPKGYLHEKFFYYQLRNIEVKDRGYSRHFRYLKETTFKVAPLNEQKRIADKLDSILTNVERAQVRLEKIPGILKCFRQSVLAAATSGELTREWRTLNNQPEGKFVLLGDIGEVIAGQSPSVLEVNFEGKGEPYVTGPEQWDGKKILHHKWTEYPKKIAPENSIFVTVKGSGVGKTFPGCHAAIGRDVYAFVPKDGVEYLYVLYAIQASAEEVVSKAKGIIPGLTKADLTEHEIYLPMIAEQIEIVRRVETLFTLTNVVEKQYAAAKSRANKLVQSILAKAFRGELVEQNSADEPATTLLERIKQQQLDVSKTVKKPRNTSKRAKNPAVHSADPSAELEEPQSDILSLLKNSPGELTVQQIIDQLSEKTFEQVDALFTELKRLLDSNLIIKVSAGEACTFKAVKR